MGEQVCLSVCLSVCIFVAVEEGQGKDGHRDVCFKLATPRLQLSPNLQLISCYTYDKTVAFRSSPPSWIPGPQMFPASRTSPISVSFFLTCPFKNQGEGEEWGMNRQMRQRDGEIITQGAFEKSWDFQLLDRCLPVSIQPYYLSYTH